MAFCWGRGSLEEVRRKIVGVFYIIVSEMVDGSNGDTLASMPLISSVKTKQITKKSLVVLFVSLFIRLMDIEP